jgi:NAD(P)-dependent dehydrogenase (short-subunit alcohol dehydrogenase family)
MSKKVALTIGATSGLGQALTQVFIDDGYQIILSSLDATRLKSIIDKPNHQIISAAKAGLKGLVREASASNASNNIHINAVAPGLLNTPEAGNLIASAASRVMPARQSPIVQ